MGGKMEEEDGHDDAIVEVKDLSKLKELTDEELVAACGGRTAHKGSRHGHKMTAKLDRIAEAEREYMEKYNKKIKEKEGKAEEKTEFDEKCVDQSEDSSMSKEKKKKKKHHLEDEIEESKRKRKKRKREVDSETSATEPKKKKKKHKK